MRILVLSADYPKFLRDLYLSKLGLVDAPYAEQLAARNDSLFGVADFYSRNFKAHGHEAKEAHINNPWLQYAWAREHGLGVLPLTPPPQPGLEASGPPLSQKLIAATKTVLRPGKPLLSPVVEPLRRRLRRMRHQRQIAQASSGDTAPVRAYAPDRVEWEHMVLRAQIEEFQPDLILNQEMAYLRSPFFKSIKRPPGMLLFGQIASSMPEDDTFEGYDMMISSLPNQVEWFRKRGLRAELNRLACDPSVLDRLGPQPERDIPLSFVGSLSPDHKSRIAFLEYLARHTELQVWGNGVERLPKSSPLRARFQGEAWGRDMYEIMRRSRITLNFHIDLAEGWANNMRLYEATGVGALLLTDWKRNLHEMFVPGEHVATYTSAEDCVAQIKKLQADEAAGRRIAEAGQAHALATQIYFLRTGEIAALAQSLRR